MDPSWQPALSAAQRRKQRRLRSWWRHEQQTVAAVLATFQHHSAPWGPRTARTGRRARVEVHGRVPEDALSQAAGAVYFEMDTGEDDGSAPAAARLAPLLEVLPQERVQQRTAEQIVDPVPVVPLLHAFVPQMVEQLVDILAPLDFRVAEQVIKVPKIVCPPRAARTVLRAPQTADQLVEVPTIISYSSLLQRTMEQNVAIPVPLGRGGRNADLPGFLRGQGPTAQSSSLERISEQIMEQIADIPVARGDLHGFRPGQSSSSIAHSPAAWLNTEDEPFQGSFPKTSSARAFRTWKPGHYCLRRLVSGSLFLCLVVAFGSTAATCSCVSSRGFRCTSRFSTCWWTSLLRSILQAPFIWRLVWSLCCLRSTSFFDCSGVLWNYFRLSLLGSTMDTRSCGRVWSSLLNFTQFLREGELGMGGTSGICFVFRACLVQRWIQVPVDTWKNSVFSPHEGGLWISAVDSCRLLTVLSFFLPQKCGSFRPPSIGTSRPRESLDGNQLLVVEGSGWRGRRESDSQVFCHLNQVYASLWQMKRHVICTASEPPPPEQEHRTHTTLSCVLVSPEAYMKI